MEIVKQVLKYFFIIFATFIYIFYRVTLNLHFEKSLSSKISLKQENSFKNHDWSYIQKNTFFRKKSFYFIDKNILIFKFIGAKANVNYDFEVKLLITYNQTQKIAHVSKLKLDKLDSNINDSSYSNYALFGYLKFEDILKSFGLVFTHDDYYTNYKFRSFKIEALIYENVFQTNISDNLLIDMKLWDMIIWEKLERTPMVCSSLAYLRSKEDLENFRQWVEINKNIGYDAIKLFLFPIDINLRDDLFEMIEKNFGTYTDIIELSVVPNLIDFDLSNKQLYFKNLEDFLLQSNSSHEKIELINELLLNECYLNSYNYFGYISSYNIDEFIMPRAYDSKLTLSSFKSNVEQSNDFKSEICSQQNHNHLIRSIDQISTFSSKQNYNSLSFSTAFYLPNNLIEKFCHKLKSKISEIDYFNRQIEIKISNEEKINDSKIGTVLFKISDQHELDYALKLCDYEENIFRPAFKNRTQILSNSKFMRFFFVETNKTGKSIHITYNLITILNNKGYKKINLKNSFDFTEAETLFVNNQYANLAQFPSFLDANEEIKVSNLYFDFYYWNCLQMIDFQ
jgi:hypothetical protein